MNEKRNKMTKEEKKFIRELFWWDHLVDTCYNYQSQLSIGFTLSMWPAIRKFYKTKEERAAALTRHLMVPYNNGAPMNTLVSGVCSALEEEASKNPEFDTNIITNIKVGLMGPVAAINDSFFFGTFRLIASAIGIALCTQGNWLGILLFILINNVPRILSIYYCGRFGYKTGINLVTDLSSSGIIDRVSKAANIVGVMIVGAMTAMMVALSTTVSWTIGEETYQLQQYLDDIFPLLLPLLITLGLYKILSKRVSMVLVMVLVLGVSILGALIGIV